MKTIENTTVIGGRGFPVIGSLRSEYLAFFKKATLCSRKLAAVVI
jgi:hypothetical protein